MTRPPITEAELKIWHDGYRAGLTDAAGICDDLCVNARDLADICADHIRSLLASDDLPAAVTDPNTGHPGGDCG